MATNGETIFEKLESYLDARERRINRPGEYRNAANDLIGELDELTARPAPVLQPKAPTKPVPIPAKAEVKPAPAVEPAKKESTPAK